MLRLPRPDPLTLTTFLALLGITASGLFEIERFLLRWLAIISLVTFCVLQSCYPVLGSSSYNQRLYERLGYRITTNEPGNGFQAEWIADSPSYLYRVLALALARNQTSIGEGARFAHA